MLLPLPIFAARQLGSCMVLPQWLCVVYSYCIHGIVHVNVPNRPSKMLVFMKTLGAWVTGVITVTEQDPSKSSFTAVILKVCRVAVRVNRSNIKCLGTFFFFRLQLDDEPWLIKLGGDSERHGLSDIYYFQLDLTTKHHTYTTCWSLFPLFNIIAVLKWLLLIFNSVISRVGNWGKIFRIKEKLR